MIRLCKLDFFFFNDTATTEIYTLSLHDALPISSGRWGSATIQLNWVEPDGYRHAGNAGGPASHGRLVRPEDRKSTRLNSSANISYAVFCLKKKKNTYYTIYSRLQSVQCHIIIN